MRSSIAQGFAVLTSISLSAPIGVDCVAAFSLLPPMTWTSSSSRTILPHNKRRGYYCHHYHRRRLNGSIGDLWEEFIEMATYGPGERRILKERRRKKAASASAAATAASQEQNGNKNKQGEGAIEEMSFSEARKRFEATTRVKDDNTISDDNDDLSTEAFRQAVSAVVASSRNNDNDDDDEEQFTTATLLLDDNFDGYALRDLLITKWGAPLDIDFQRDASLTEVYCNILPIAYGQRLKCRHETELDYLMHLQGIVEVLRKYNQLDEFVTFVACTNKRPKAGTDSVPYRLQLNDEQKRQIL